MTRASHNRKARGISELNAGHENNAQCFKNETTARTALRLLESPKEWAARLEVSHQKVNEWVRGEPIPSARMFQIAEEAKLIYLKNLNPLQTEIDLMMLMQFGRLE